MLGGGTSGPGSANLNIRCHLYKEKEFVRLVGCFWCFGMVWSFGGWLFSFFWFLVPDGFDDFPRFR